jgi:hypothetical protein
MTMRVWRVSSERAAHVHYLLAHGAETDDEAVESHMVSVASSDTSRSLWSAWLL